MADRSGYAIKAAIKRPAETSSYGTEATSMTNQIPLLSESMTKTPELVRSGAVQGLASTPDVVAAAFNPGGAITTELWYEGLEYLWNAALGFESPDVPVIRTAASFDQGGSPAPNDASPESFLHVWEADENIQREVWSSGERDVSGAGDYVWTSSDQKVRTVSLAIDKGEGSPSVNHWVDCMVNKVTIRGAHGKPVTVDWDLIPRSASYTGASTSWALPDYGPPRPAYFTQAKFYLTPPGSALATEFGISSFELTIENNLKADDYETGGNDLSTGYSYRTEPTRNDRRRVTLKIGIARLNSASATLDSTIFQTNAAIQCKLVLTGPDISGSAYPYKYEFALPLAKVISAPFPVSGPGVISGDAEILAYQPTSTNYGYTWVRDLFGGVHRKKMNEIAVALTNTRGSCFSRDRNTAYPLP